MNQDILDEEIIRKLISNEYNDNECIENECIENEYVEVEVYDSIDSTNLELKRRVRNGSLSGNEYTLIVADEQTGGRGRLGRTFESPKGSGIYMSFHLRPRDMDEDVMLITTAAAVAVARGIEKSTGVETRIKWVNDIYADGRKVSGILAEAVTDPQGHYHIILGIGINVVMPEDRFGEELRDIAGALFCNKEQQNVSRNEIVTAIAASFINIYERISEREYMREYRERSLVIGKEVRYMKENVWHEAVVTGIDDDGGLLIEENGDRITLRTGEITLRLIDKKY